MLFNTLAFFIFFPVVWLVYFVCPSRFRYLWLLAASLYFYMQWNPAYIMLLLGCIIVTYFAARFIEQSDKPVAKKTLFVSALTILLLVLAFFKYLNLLLSYSNLLLGVLHLPRVPFQPDILLPVGISFFTLQSLGYLIDVYRGDTYAEKNFFLYALFISFFPQLVAGPIERSKNLLVQLHTSQKPQYDNLRKGVLWILWGLFLKMVIADRIAIIVDRVYGNRPEYGGLYILYATVLFSIQIYCDFHGYSTIARGCALTFGYRLMDNFNAPYYSKTVKEFWQRWHISLSGWFRDYVYIPLGGSRHGTSRTNRNLLITFGISGLWHGASAAFVFWGLLNGIYQILGEMLRPWKEALTRHVVSSYDDSVEKQEPHFSKGLLKGLCTFCLISFAWLFFRAGDMSEALLMVKSLFSFQNKYIFFDGSLYSLGVSREMLQFAYLCIALLFFVDYQKYKGIDVADAVLRQGWWFRVVAFSGMLLLVLLFGCYGELYDLQQFIYFQF